MVIFFVPLLEKNKIPRGGLQLAKLTFDASNARSYEVRGLPHQITGDAGLMMCTQDGNHVLSQSYRARTPCSTMTVIAGKTKVSIKVAMQTELHCGSLPRPYCNDRPHDQLLCQVKAPFRVLSKATITAPFHFFFTRCNLYRLL